MMLYPTQLMPTNENVVPPEELLIVPSESTPIKSNTEAELESRVQVPQTQWLVLARNRRVNRDWEALLLRAPENARRCYEDLCNAPMLRQPKRVFPLKGKRYKGAWEYEVTSGERVFYVPDPQRLKVVVYYAGEHPKKNAPTPP